MARWAIKKTFINLFLQLKSLMTLAFVFCCFSPSLAYTIPELIKTPESFYQRSVTVVGEVSDVVTRYSEKPYTTFMLSDDTDIRLPVFVWGTPTFKRGQVCRVAGTFVKEKVLGAYALKQGIEATDVKKTSEAELRTVSTIFKKRKKTGIRGARGFYIPQ
jgi:hypothetical protein